MIPRPYELSQTVDGVATLQIATDDAPHVSAASLAGLADAVQRIRQDPSVRALVLVGGERHFCSGATADTLLGDDPPQAIAELLGGFPRLLLSLDIPTLAAMAGHAIGGGMMLGLWTDVAILADESLYGANFVALGFTPGMGSTVVLDEVLGAPFARELLLTGRLVKGREIRAAGVPLSHAVVPRDQVLASTYLRAAEMANVPREAMRLLRRHIAARRLAQLELATAEELTMHAEVFAHPETRAHIREAYPEASSETRTT